MKKITFVLLMMIFCFGLTSLGHAEGVCHTSKNGLYYLEFAGSKYKQGVIYLHCNPQTKSWVSVHENPRTHSWAKRIINKHTETYDMLERISESSGQYVFAIARPGFSKSKGKLSHDLDRDSFNNKHLTEIVKCIEELKAKYGINSFTLMGYQAGATLAAEIAILYPELVSDVILYDGNYDTDAWTWMQNEEKVSYEVNPMKTLEEVQMPSIQFSIYYGKESKCRQLSKQFAAKLKERGVNSVRLAELNFTQGNFFEYMKAIKDLAAVF